MKHAKSKGAVRLILGGAFAAALVALMLPLPSASARIRGGCNDDCLEHCKQQCDKANERCIKNCPRGDRDCMNNCNQELGRCLKDCDRKCK
jgi:hypothetical protein